MHLGKKRRSLSAEKHAAIAVYIVVFIGQFISLDQVRLVWLERETSGVSFMTWAFFTVSSSAWCAYGYIRKDRVLVLTNCIWICINGAVALGVLMHAS
jgi:uncharacterized protein with PQ loop repeat